MAAEPELISKKELLEITGISYGQLYRWKRKGLIPEEWFVKKAAFTGQETFLPKGEILERVQRIQGLKEDVPLDDLARLLSPRPADGAFHGAELVARNIISQAALDLWQATLGPREPLDFQAALQARVVEEPLAAGALSLEEGALMLRTLAAAGEPPLAGQALFLRKRGVGFCLLVQGPAVLDPEARVAARVDLAAQVAALKLALDPLGRA
jgi:DNA-binding transcriptional MerR regulator